MLCTNSSLVGSFLDFPSKRSRKGSSNIPVVPIEVEKGRESMKGLFFDGPSFEEDVIDKAHTSAQRASVCKK